MRFAVRVLLASILCFTLAPKHAFCGQAASKAPDMTIFVDARSPWKRRIPVRLTLPGRPGPLALIFPRWLPGSHSADSLLGNYARLKMTADGEPLAWNRDPFDPYRIRAEVPNGAKVVEADYEYVPPKSASSEVFYGVAAGKNLAVINPSAFSFAPEGDIHAFTAVLSVRLPEGWSASTALSTAATLRQEADTVTYAPVSLYTLIDSPLMAGKYHKTLALPTPPNDVPHFLDLYADNEEILRQKEGIVTPLLTRLTAESGRMFGVRHYQAFRYMVALSTDIGRNGLEHHDSVAYVLQPADLDEEQRALPFTWWQQMLIPHEFVHSWNGKFRRPYGEDARTNTAMQSSDLIWVYEGLTQYLGEVLMVRSGFRSLAAWRSDMTGRAAGLRLGHGQDWQSVADTAITTPYTDLHGSGTSLRSVNDVYMEGMLIWLEADAIIRRESKGERSLDDFCRVFFGGPNHGPEIVRYTLKEVVEALKRVQPYDWAAFIQARFYDPPKGLPTAGLEAAGWKLTFGDAPVRPGGGAATDYRFSLGIILNREGGILDVLPSTPAERAGLEDRMVLLGVNGYVYTPARLQEAVRATRGGKAPLELLISDGSKYRTLRVDGMDGERYPLLAREPLRPDLLLTITAPLKFAVKK